MDSEAAKPALSIIMPVYNARSYLASNLKALLRQKDPRLELVLVDDGSTDGSGSIAGALLVQSGISYRLLTQENRGVSAARNAGLAEARGDYVLFLDADDRLREDFVAQFLQAAQEGEDVLLWRCRALPEGQKLPEDTDVPVWTDSSGSQLLPEIILEHKGWYHPVTVALRREFLLQHGLKFTEGCACGEDQEMILKSLSLAGKVKKTETILAFYIQRKGSAMRTCNWNRFDVVYALLRLADHMDSLDQPWAPDAAAEVRGRRLLSNFFLNLKSCYRQAGAPEPRAWLKELYTHHPRLPEILQPLLRNCPGLERKLRWEARLFLIAPHLYLQQVGRRKRPDEQSEDHL